METRKILNLILTTSLLGNQVFAHYKENVLTREEKRRGRGGGEGGGRTVFVFM